MIDAPVLPVTVRVLERAPILAGEPGGVAFAFKGDRSVFVGVAAAGAATTAVPAAHVSTTEGLAVLFVAWLPPKSTTRIGNENAASDSVVECDGFLAFAGNCTKAGPAAGGGNGETSAELAV